MSGGLPILPSLSQTPRAFECAAALLLPQCHTPVGRPADQGTAVHAYLNQVTELGAEKAFESVPEEFKDACESINLKRLPLHAAGIQHEVAVAYNPDTGVGRVIGVNLHGAYRDLAWCAAHGVDRTREIVGALDTVQLDANGTAFSWEWKTGWGAQTNAARAPLNHQLLTGGLAYARAAGAAALEAWVVRISETGWVDDRDHVALDALEMVDLEARIQKKVQAFRKTAQVIADGKTPDVFEGPWCKHCKAFNACPAKTALIAKAVTAPATLLDQVAELIRQPQNREKAYRLWRLVEDLSGKLREQVCAHACVEPIRLGNGHVFGQHPTERKVLDGEKTFKILQDDPLYGLDAALKAVEMKTSQSAIKAAAKAAGQKQATELRRIMGRLEEEGGLAKKPVLKMEEFDPGELTAVPANSDAETP